jgi:hypothetical protein
MPTVFISYSSNDRDIAHTFRGLIEALGYEVWMDIESIEPSKAWSSSLVTGLEGADWLLVLVSRNSVTSEWVKWETRWAIEHLPSRVIPVALDDTKPENIDPGLAELQYGNYGAYPQQSMNQLVKILSDARYAGYARDIVGKWISAVQPVYYQRDGWHVQDVEISASSDVYTVKTVPATSKLQWRLDAKLFANAFLAGPWHSTREGSRSQGYMTLQLARNGTYMCGHDYALAFGDSEAHFGVMLLSRTEEHLRVAWQAMKAAHIEMLSLDERTDF